MGSFEYDSSDIPDSVRSYLRGFQKAVDQQNVDEILQVFSFNESVLFSFLELRNGLEQDQRALLQDYSLATLEGSRGTSRSR